MYYDPLDSLISGLLILFVLWSIPVIWYLVLNYRHTISLYKDNETLRTENNELREKLIKYEQSEPEWVRQLGWKLFEDAPSDPAISALN